jgi:tRNA U34 5-methylaminomethyl-2-thiouridine-forming methyltransferase MnmC
LSPIELEHLQTRAAVPYRDPGLGDEAGAIVARREQEQRSSELEVSRSWRRRWKIV